MAKFTLCRFNYDDHILHQVICQMYHEANIISQSDYLCIFKSIVADYTEQYQWLLINFMSSFWFQI